MKIHAVSVFVVSSLFCQLSFLILLVRSSLPGTLWIHVYPFGTFLISICLYASFLGSFSSFGSFGFVTSLLTSLSLSQVWLVELPLSFYTIRFLLYSTLTWLTSFAVIWLYQKQSKTDTWPRKTRWPGDYTVWHLLHQKPRPLQVYKNETWRLQSQPGHINRHW